jgi:hypothetical protein
VKESGNRPENEGDQVTVDLIRGGLWFSHAEPEFLDIGGRSLTVARPLKFYIFCGILLKELQNVHQCVSALLEVNKVFAI